MMNDINTLLDQAFDAYNRQDFTTAETMARMVLSMAHEEPDALYLLGLLAFKSYTFKQSELFLTQAHFLRPDNENYTLALAFTLQCLGQGERSLALYQPYSENAEALSQTGMIHLMYHRIPFAKTAFQKALSLDPSLPSAWIGKALIEKTKGHLKTAEEILKKMPLKNQDTFKQLGYIYREQGALKKAVSAFEKALAYAQSPDAWHILGQIYCELNHPKKALDAYNHALKITPNNPDILVDKATLCPEKQAKSLYEHALQENPNYIPALHNLACLYTKHKEPAKALDLYQRIIQLNPQHLPSLYNLAIILEEESSWSEALGLYFNLLILKADFLDLPFRISACITELFQTGKEGEKEALRFAKGWIKHFAKDPIALHTYAALTHKKGVNSLDYLKRFYNHFSGTYDDTMHLLQAESLNVILKNLPKTSFHNILDLGCGTGKFGSLYKRPFKTLTGVDLSEEMLNKAPKKYTHLICQDIFTYLTKTKKTFDLIILAEVACYIADMESLFKDLMPHMKKGTFLALTTETALKQQTLSPYGRWAYPDEKIEKILHNLGLKLIRKTSFPLRKEKEVILPGTFFLIQRT